MDATTHPGFTMGMGFLCTRAGTVREKQGRGRLVCAPPLVRHLLELGVGQVAAYDVGHVLAVEVVFEPAPMQGHQLLQVLHKRSDGELGDGRAPPRPTTRTWWPGSVYPLT
jgi:hypothetical protein